MPVSRKISAKAGTLLGLALCMAILPIFFPSSYYLRVGAMVYVNAFAVIGIVVLTGYVGQISLGHAGFIGIGAYSCALLPPHLGLPVALAALVGALLSGLLAWLVGQPVLRLKGYYLSVATLGLGILVSMVLANEVQITGGPDGMAVPDIGLRQWLGILLGWKMNNAQFWYGASALALLAGAWVALNLRDSATGRALRALHGSEVAARTVGINVARYKLQGFVISAMYASLAGSLLAMQNKFVTPEVASFMHSVEIVTMAVLGGAASVLGGIFGAAILTILPQALTFLQEYEQIMLGLIMVLIMIGMREGLLPGLARILGGKS